MAQGWPFEERAELSPEIYLRGLGSIFAVFDARTQESGNVSYGFEADGRRWFVKTAGHPADRSVHLSHAARVALLANARRLSQSVTHYSLPALKSVLASAWGPMLIYEWVSGELVGTNAQRRTEAASAFYRFQRLPTPELESAIDTILDAHVELCRRGWVACDFYDGAIMYDFSARRLHLVDLDNYHLGPFRNEMGRMFGSTRFMAPEEFERGAVIDERTTVFTLGRALSVFLGEGVLARETFRGDERQYNAMLRACADDRTKRFQSVAALAAAWRG